MSLYLNSRVAIARSPYKAPKPRNPKSYAGSGLPQGPFLENYLFALKVGLRWVSVNALKWVQKWVKSGFLGAKVGQNASKPTFPPTSNPFRQIHENPLSTQFKGGGNGFSEKAPEAVPTQHNPKVNFKV